MAIGAVPVISTPTYGNMTAPAVVKQFKNQSQKDTKQLAEAKEIAYKEGFYNGTMIIGEFRGDSIQDAKPKVCEAMIKGLAFPYAEPEGLVISRSADEYSIAYSPRLKIKLGLASKMGTPSRVTSLIGF